LNQNNNENIDREYTRVPKEAHIEISQLEYPPSDTPGDPAIAKNIAENGLCLKVSTPYKPKTIISLKIDLKGWRQYLKNVSFRVDETKAKAPLTAVAEVVWCNNIDENEYEVGLKFIDIYEDDRIAFNNYLKAISNSVS